MILQNKNFLYFLFITIVLSGCEKKHLPETSVESVKYITHNSAIINTTINSDIGYPWGDHGVYHSNNSKFLNPLLLEAVTGFQYEDSNFQGEFTYMIDNLTPDTKYYITAFAENNNGRGYSDTTSFQTKEVEYFTDPRDNQKYTSIEIGNQVWFAENLKYEAIEGSFCYDQDTMMATTYGRLYSHKSAMHSCPEGWHLPSDEEWKELELSIGMPKVSVDSMDLRGTTEAGKIKQVGKSSWGIITSNVTNETGFSALAAGDYTPAFTDYYNLNFSTTFWTSTEFDDATAYTRRLFNHTDKIRRINFNKEFGYSVRCIKD